jgi:hypothetical protein
MGNLGNFWDLNDYINAREAWIAPQGYNHRSIIVMKFAGYETSGTGVNPDEQFRAPKYTARSDHAWISQVKVFDTVKGGYFTTGDLDIYTTFRIQGYTPAYTLPSGVNVTEYAGDQIIWNGKVWVVSDQVEPVQFGYQAKEVWWRTVLRRTDRAGQGNVVGP